ncbi:MAG: ribosome-binding factor A [Gammaproteobacteria bacterium]|nr:ribosome-binding factor A [Gammaproteobacteria bacterium]OUT97249.1 MAG: ribosome-binding factor A [Gammaproteobacteria bacterium TMED36]
MTNDFSINSRVEAKIHRILSETIIHDIKDPRLKNVSINEVKLSPDLSNAKIYCSCFIMSKDDSSELVSLISKASGIFKKNIGKRVSLKKIPQLSFIFDDHEEYANQLTDLIDNTVKNDSKK